MQKRRKNMKRKQSQMLKKVKRQTPLKSKNSDINQKLSWRRKVNLKLSLSRCLQLKLRKILKYNCLKLTILIKFNSQSQSQRRKNKSNPAHKIVLLKKWKANLTQNNKNFPKARNRPSLNHLLTVKEKVVCRKRNFNPMFLRSKKYLIHLKHHLMKNKW